MLEGQPFLTKELVNQGLVPRETVRFGVTVPLPLYCPEDRAVIHAVATGQVPDAGLENRTLLIKRLANQGLVPRAAVPPCR